MLLPKTNPRPTQPRHSQRSPRSDESLFPAQGKKSKPAPLQTKDAAPNTLPSRNLFATRREGLRRSALLPPACRTFMSDIQAPITYTLQTLFSARLALILEGNIKGSAVPSARNRAIARLLCDESLRSASFPVKASS